MLLADEIIEVRGPNSGCEGFHVHNYTLFHTCEAKRGDYTGRMSMKTILIGIVVIIIIAVGAYFLIKKSTPTPPGQAPSGQNTTDQVQAQEVTVGTGTQATPGTAVSVLYVGKLSDGTVFDSSAAHGNQPLTFQLGTPGLIAGFQVGVNGMKEGGERVISIPPALGYGAQDVKDASGKVVIPANSTLLFDIKLVKVEAAPAASSTAPEAAATKK